MSQKKSLTFIVDKVEKILLLIFYLCSLWEVEGDGRLKDVSFYPNSIFEWKSEIGLSSSSRIIPDHHFVSAFLNEGISKRFLYMKEDRVGNVLSILVTPCTSDKILWSVRFLSSSYLNTTSRVNKEPELLKSFRTQRSATFYDLKSRRGVYIVEIKALYSDSYVHLYAKTADEPVRIPSNFIETSDINPGVPKPKIQIRRLRGHRIHVKWEPSAHNPHLVRYCIVVNSHRDYSTLCAAQGVKYGVLPPDLMHVSYYYFPFDKPARRRPPSSYVQSEQNDRDQQQQQTHQDDEDFQQNLMPNHPHRHRHSGASGDSLEERERSRDLIIGCVNQKTNYILNNLREGKLYYFNVFIQDSSTNFTYPYLRTTINTKYKKSLPNGITDGKAMKLSVDGKNGMLVKFNVKKPCALRIYVMPCGGNISYKLIHAYKSIIESQPIDSLHILKIDMPETGRYYIRLSQTHSPSQLNNNDNNNNNSTPIPPRIVELYVSKRNKRFPLPKLPHSTQIIEELRERTCDSVKLIWLPSPDPKDNEYCIFLKEETRKRIFNFKKPNQCDIERSLNSDPWVTHSMCIQRSPPKFGHYLSQTISGLQPDKIYIVQLILRRHKGKALSYDLMQVATLSRCSDNYTND